MEQQRLKNRYLNYFDALVALIIVIFLGMCIYGFFFYSEPVADKKIYLVIKVPAENIEEVVEQNRTIFLNGVDSPVLVNSVVREADNLLLTLEAPGKIDGGSIIFNGQRVAINQKTEIHGLYFAQGRIISASNE